MIRGATTFGGSMPRATSWVVLATCGHGRFEGQSAGSIGFRSALLAACQEFVTGHGGD